MSADSQPDFPSWRPTTPLPLNSSAQVTNSAGASTNPGLDAIKAPPTLAISGLRSHTPASRILTRPIHRQLRKPTITTLACHQPPPCPNPLSPPPAPPRCNLTLGLLRVLLPFLRGPLAQPPQLLLPPRRAAVGAPSPRARMARDVLAQPLLHVLWLTHDVYFHSDDSLRPNRPRHCARECCPGNR
jgi:hypothetical protein